MTNRKVNILGNVLNFNENQDVWNFNSIKILTHKSAF